MESVKTREAKWSTNEIAPSWSKASQVGLINSLKTPHIWNYTLKEMDGMKEPGALLEEREVLVMQEEKAVG